MKNLFCLLIIFIFFIPFLSKAQQDTTGKKLDSLGKQQLNNGLNKVTQLSAERLSDSLKLAELQREVAKLTSNQQGKRTTLLAELKALERRDSIHKVSQKAQIDSLRKFVKGTPVKFNGDALFYIYARQGSFTANDRAQAVALRIEKLADNPIFSADSLKIIPAEQTVDLTYGASLLLSLSDQDALWKETSKEKLAVQTKDFIAKAVINYKQETSWQVILKEILLALLVISVVILLIKGINRLFLWLELKLKSNSEKFENKLKIKNYELLKPEQQLRVINNVVKILRWAVIILVIYLALPVLFGIFPFTRDLSANLLNYILNPLKKIGISIFTYIPNMITILVIVIVFRYVTRFLSFIKTEVERGKLHIPGFYPDWANPTYQIARALLLAFMLVVIFPYLPGHDSDIFKGVSVFMGVLFTFGSAGALSNVVAGLVLTYMRAFKIGDRVKIGEVTGDIIEKNLLVTRIRTIQNEIISIPNSTVMGNHTVNYSEEASHSGLIINTTVTIGYDVPWRQVHQLLIDATLETTMIEQEPKPYVYQTSLDDYYVSYRINGYTKQPNKQAAIYSSLHANIQDHFNKAGVEIMSPHYKALRDGNLTTIPSTYLPKDYQAPTFKTSSDEVKKPN